MSLWLGIALGVAAGAGTTAGFGRLRSGGRRLSLSPVSGGATTAPTQARREDGPAIEVVPRRRLPTFGDVGGLDDLKAEIRQTIGLLLDHPEAAQRFRITWNGLLVHGPPGSGKSFLVRAVAGELGLNLIPVTTADLVSETGDGAARVAATFEFASHHLPCLLFFDELDAVARERDSGVGQDGREVLTQLLSSLEAWREEPRLVVAAATNDLDALDPAVMRAGRFDRHIRLDLPDEAARRSVLEVALAGRPHAADLPLDDLARRTRGRTPADLVQLCDAAALSAFRAAIGGEGPQRITAEHLLAALDQAGGEDRPTVEDMGWDDLVLAPEVLAELQQVQAFLEDPTLADRLGVAAPNGVLLTGPPGTGKTTVAKVLAAEAACSFYPMSGAELSSRWLGESEKAIARLFRRARANAPSIVFLDEIDAIGAARGAWGAYDRQLDQLLQELDGMGSTPGVLLLGATNRPNALDPALLRSGRLGRIIELPLPDEEQRRRLLELHTARMPLDAVDLDALAAATEGFSGADLRGLCQQAAIRSLVRDPAASLVSGDDFDHALAVGDELLAHRGRTPDPTRPRRRRPLRAE